jgi:hypothetical protein
MSSHLSFRRTLRAAHLKLVYSNARTPEENLRILEDAVHRVSLSMPLPHEEEAKVLEVDKTSVLSLPRRDRDPALVIQEINGCKSLLLEVIRRAAYDWVLYRTSTRLFNKKLAEQAYEWLFKEEPGTPEWRERDESGKNVTAFVSICFALDLPPEIVREHVRKLTPKNVMSVGRPPEYRRREPLQSARGELSIALDPTELEDEWNGSGNSDD